MDHHYLSQTLPKLFIPPLQYTETRDSEINPKVSNLKRLTRGRVENEEVKQMPPQFERM
jgi:hypothetical protein